MKNGVLPIKQTFKISKNFVFLTAQVVKTKIKDFYNELIWLISYKEH